VNIVYDSNALIAYLEDEPGAESVDALLSDDSANGFVHSVNLCEVYYHVRRKQGEDAADAACDTLKNLGLEVREDLDDDFWKAAGAIKSDYRRVSLADCSCIALANRLDARMLTCDRHEIQSLAEAKVCKVEFVR